MTAGRRAMLEVHWSHPTMPVRRAVLDPGRSLLVGRTERADLRVPADRQMSGVHFELAWDGSRCLLLDRSSAAGTWLDGLRVDAGEVKNGGWIRAGTTLFMLFHEGPPERHLPPDPPAVAESKDRALAALLAETEPLYALLDAARSPRVMELLRWSPEPRRSLHDRLEAAALADVAPHLVHLPAGGALLPRLVQEGWGASWGIYLTSRRPFEELRRHLRRLLRPELARPSERRQRVYFRFYDPRVLRVFLPVCTARQAAEVFACASAFVMEGDGGGVLRFAPPP